jgi:RNA polymerase sigma-70 factor (sigma-E family)
VDKVHTPPVPSAAPDARSQVTSLYQAHALGLVRLAVVMLGDEEAARDVVQDAFLGLYRQWGGLSDSSRALAYVRSSVLNGCRTVQRRNSRYIRWVFAEPTLESAEARALAGEEHREVIAALRKLPYRQREALVLRFYLDMDEVEVAEAMRISRGSVKSATSRAIAALGRMLREDS